MTAKKMIDNPASGWGDADNDEDRVDERVMPGSTSNESSRPRPRVLVVGAGIAGMTAAHELAVRGFDVIVMESEGDDRGTGSPARPWQPDPTHPVPKLGGLAASQFEKIDSPRLRPFFLPEDDRLGAPAVHRKGRRLSPREAATQDLDLLRKELSEFHGHVDHVPQIVGEHGFRFFPAYYLHLWDTLQRIPIYDANGQRTHRTVYDNIVEVTTQAVSTTDNQPSLIFPRRPPTSLTELLSINEQLRDVGVGASDIEQLGRLILRYLATSAERRTADFELISAYEYFVGLDPATGHHAHHYSTGVEELLRNMPRVLAAFNSEWGDARTNISTFLQLQLRMSEENKADGVLNGATATQWFDHWGLELRRLGVTFRQAAVTDLELHHKADGAVVRLGDRLRVLDAQHEAEAASELAQRLDATATRTDADPEADDDEKLRTRRVADAAEAASEAAAAAHKAAQARAETGNAVAAGGPTDEQRRDFESAIGNHRQMERELREAERERRSAIVRNSGERPIAGGHDPTDYAEPHRRVLGIDRRLRRRVNRALLATMKRDDVRAALRRVRWGIPWAQPGIVHPDDLNDVRTLSYFVEIVLSWVGLTVTADHGAWLVNDDVFRELELALADGPTPGSRHTADHLSPRERHHARSELWAALKDFVRKPVPEVPSSKKLAKDLGESFAQHLETLGGGRPGRGGTDPNEVIKRLDDAIDLHRQIDEATLAVHFRENGEDSHVLLQDQDASFDYCVLAVPAHVAESLTGKLNDLGLGGTISDLEGFTTWAPPELGPLEPQGKRRRRPKDVQVRCPVCMDSLGTKPWDRFQTLAGIQYYFTTEFQLARGHVYYADAEWALSSINQHGLWEERPSLRQNGFVSVLSVDIGDWNRRVPIRDPATGLTEQKAARDCTPDELAQEVWRQICTSLLGEMQPDVMDLDQDRRRDIQRWAERLPRPAWYLVDRNLRFATSSTCVSCNPSSTGTAPEFEPEKPVVTNAAPYLVPIVGDWFNRPGGFPWNPHGTSMIIRPTERTWRRELRDRWTWQARHGGYQVHFGKHQHEGGLVFAGTWCKTFTRMTTMEAACESGRHAVNAILDHFLWINTEGQRETEERPLIRPPERSPIEHMTGPVRHPTALGDYCFVFDIENREPMDLRPTRLLDRRFYFDDKAHPWELLGGRPYSLDDLLAFNPLSPSYFERIAGQLRDWRSLLEGLDHETRPLRRTLSGQPPVSVAEDGRDPHRKLYYVPGSNRVYEFMAYPETAYQEHLATALADARDSSRRSYAGYDRMGRRIRRGPL